MVTAHALQAENIPAITRLERGELVLLPTEPFVLTAEEQAFLRPDCVGSSKSIKYSITSHKLWGMADEYAGSPMLTGMLKRYAGFAQHLIARIAPNYTGSMIAGNTSFRPVETEGRIQSKRHDDRLLHVDAFPSRPMHGKRILRVFSNVHPKGLARQWRTGEPFADVAARFLPHIGAPLPGSAALLNLLGITKERRSPYDHYMLQMHDRMKLDDEYQRTVSYTNVALPAGSSWIVFTDQVSHAALSGQHAMEQTFLLPPEAMANPALSPLKVLEKMAGRPLA